MSALADLLQRLRPRAHRLGEAVGRVVYPPHCVVCGRPVGGDEDRYLCRGCIARIQFVVEPTCPRCGHEVGEYTPGTRCLVCRNLPMRFDRAVAAAHHTGAVREMVLAFKFAAQQHNAFPLSKLLAARLADTEIPEKAQFIVPVPLHRRRLRSRGFNQSEVLARELGERLGLPVLTGKLRRVIDTPPQTRATSAAQRRANVKGAFAVRSRKAVDGRTLLLVDDVLTTGATTSECAGVLKRAGARHVYVATVTRRMSIPPQPDAPLARYEIESLVPPGDFPTDEAPPSEPPRLPRE